jgi:hypothetical protein
MLTFSVHPSKPNEWVEFACRGVAFRVAVVRDPRGSLKMLVDAPREDVVVVRSWAKSLEAKT